MLKHPGAERTPGQQYLTPAVPLRVHDLLHKPVYNIITGFALFWWQLSKVCCMILADPSPRVGMLAGSQGGLTKYGLPPITQHMMHTLRHIIT